MGRPSWLYDASIAGVLMLADVLEYGEKLWMALLLTIIFLIIFFYYDVYFDSGDVYKLVIKSYQKRK